MIQKGSVCMIKRESSLEGHVNKGFFGKKEENGVVLSEIKDLILYQVAAWPDTVDIVGKKVSKALKLEDYPISNKSVNNKNVSMLRVEPLKWWIIGSSVEKILPEEGTILDISQSRTHIRIQGNKATDLLNRHLPIDLREKSFPLNSLSTTAFHHCTVTLWRSKNGYELFLPRAFSLSLWEIVFESSLQFGCEIK